MISYAQNGEDVVLHRALGEVIDGFYIDVGASDPLVDSVTAFFYERGWSGVNVEPALGAYAALQGARERDVNLPLGLGAAPGELRFYELPPQLNGCSTFSDEVVQGYRDRGWTIEERTVEIVTLASICERWARDRTVEFLKVDVEGQEEAVIDGADFRRFRPRILVFEATEPGTQIASWQRWEPKVLDEGYLFGLFDGINRFYVREEDRKLLPRIASPANVLDDFETYPVAVLRREEARLRQAASEARRLAEGLGRDLQALRRGYDANVESLARARNELARAEGRLADARVERDSVRRALLDQVAGDEVVSDR